MRAVHEASLYESNCFLTLTYSEEHVPRSGSLDYSAPVEFMRRLRERFGAGIRSFGCGEYGEKFSRPHYHLCLFNFDFPDKKLWKKVGTHGEFDLSRSKELEDLWKFGHSTVGTLTFQSAAYVARYVTKKFTGPAAQKHYERPVLSPSGRWFGEVVDLAPERALCVSRMPGLGKEWFERFGERAYARGFLYMNGRKVAPPKYYDRLFEIDHPEEFAKVKELRRQAGEEASAELERESAKAFCDAVAGRSLRDPSLLCVPEHRLSVIEQCQELSFKLLRRGFENA